MGETAWKWGNYKLGMGVEGDDPRLIYACRAIKRELAFLGYSDLNMETDRIGGRDRRVIRDWQSKNGLKVDGEVGPKTANSLWRFRIDAEQKRLKIPLDWLRAQIHWESLDDPGAQLTNADGSRDRGLIQHNSGSAVLTDDEAFDPAASIPFLASFHKTGAKLFRDCEVDKHRLAVARWRSPVGALEWCKEPNTLDDPDGTWGEKVVHYVTKVDTIGRMGWVG